MLIFNRKYFSLFALLLLIEILIALYMNDRIIRPYIGDVLVVILIYCFLKSFFRIPVITAAISVLIFACLIEFLQYMQIVDRLGLTNYKLAKIIIGNTFQWMDIVAYTLGIMLVLLFEFLFKQK